MEKIINNLEERAKKAYSKYSNFSVSCCIEIEDKYFYGVNIENASYPLSCCAERVALHNAFLNANDLSKASAVFVYSDSKVFPFPCGACLQVLNEFFSPEIKVVLVNKNKQIKKLTLKQLLPYPFEGEQNV